MAPSSSVSPARGFTLMTEDLVEKMRTEAQIASAASILRGVNALHLTSDAASALELAREALGEVSRAIQSSNAARVGEVQKAEIRALTRVCRVGGALPTTGWTSRGGRLTSSCAEPTSTNSPSPRRAPTTTVESPPRCAST